MIAAAPPTPTDLALVGLIFAAVIAVLAAETRQRTRRQRPARTLVVRPRRHVRPRSNPPYDHAKEPNR